MFDRRSKAFTITELMVSVAIGTVVMGFILIPYFSLQKGFNFAMNWSDSRISQARLIDSMAQDLRNARAVTTNNGSLPLTLTIPMRYSGYESSGKFGGDPLIDGTMLPALVDSSTGKVVYANPNVTVIYEQSGNTINRRLVRSGVSDATREIASFSAGISVSFKNSNGGVPASADDTIVPTVSATVASVADGKSTVTSMTSTVFLRAAVIK